MSARDILRRLQQRGVLDAVDVQLAEVLRRIVGEQSVEVQLGAALASRAVQRGHVCADLPRLSRVPLLDSDDNPVTDIGFPKLGPWLTALSASKLVGDGSAHTPLVVDEQGRLYLWRYFDYQRRLADRIARRAEQQVRVDHDLLAAGVARLFGAPRGDDGDLQRVAAAVACLRRFSVISGGPGTGKTTTVAKILVLLQEQALAEGPLLRIALLAPTGKAAQRLGESIEQSVAGLEASDAVKASIPRRASTVHRALGFSPRTPTRFRHGAHTPLSVDVVLADEASMIDLALMAKLVEAVPNHARLILLGDKDQLASVEAGAIVGDIYDGELEPGYSPAFASAVSSIVGVAVTARQGVPPLADCLVQLTKSYRYSAQSGIGALALAVNAGDPDRAMRILEGDAAMPYGEVAIAACDEHDPLAGTLGTSALDGYRAYIEASEPARKLELLGRFRILCAHRRGLLGVDTLNLLVAEHLRRAGMLSTDGAHHHNRPIMITRNDHQIGLYNGDVGVVVAGAPGGDGAWFWGDGGPRCLPVSRLPPHETVFAMTVHKSQGSEFDRVALVLPAKVSPVITRELVYTAVSRARKRVDVHGAEHVFRHAITRRTERASGLCDALWGDQARSSSG